MTNLQKLQITSVLILIAFGTAFFDGMLGLGFSDDVYVLLGLVELVAIIWQTKIVFSKKRNR